MKIAENGKLCGTRMSLLFRLTYLLNVNIPFSLYLLTPLGSNYRTTLVFPPLITRRIKSDFSLVTANLHSS